MKDPYKCFILTPDGYEEITYTELTRRRKADATYRDRRFIPVQGMLLEVSEDNYKAFYKDTERQKYLRKEAKRMDEMSYNALYTDEMNGEGSLPDLSPPLADVIADKLVLEAMRIGLDKLSEEERALLTALYFEGKSERELARETGIPQKTVNDRRHRALFKLKELMKIYPLTPSLFSFEKVRGVFDRLGDL
jgi:RNA polymerase sigma factor (sigma-70 family)